MLYAIDDALKRQARAPHELLMINLAAFHLLLAPASIALDIGAWGLALPPLFSSLVITYIYLRSHRAATPWFALMHWRLAWRRCRLQLMGYSASALIIGGGSLLALSAQKQSMREIIFTIATRVGVMPTIVMVLVLFVLANSGLEMAGKGEVPDGLLKRYPEEGAPR
jgi:membrane-associated HD superfamily phosphohydrolase